MRARTLMPLFGVLVTLESASAETLFTVDAKATAANVTECVRKAAASCLTGGIPKNPNWSAEDCLLVWKSCEHNPSNIVQSSIEVGYQVITKELRDQIKEVVEAVKKNFENESKRQHERFMEMLKRLGWNLR